MKDGMEYAEMLEMPVYSCDVVFKPARRKKKKNLKEEVIAKVNEETPSAEAESAPIEEEFKEVEVLKTRTRTKKEKPPREKKKFSFDIVYAEGVAVFLLVAAILLTNIFWEDSGINTVFRNTFGTTSKVSQDTRTYLSFNAKSPSEELPASVTEGVMTFTGKGSLYPVCDGKLTSVEEKDGKYTLTVSHSDVFKTVISGVDYVYAEQGEEVFKYIPIGYVNGGSVSVSMFQDGVLLTGYVLENGSILWES